MAFVASLDLVSGVLRGEIRAIARLLTRAEQGAEESRPALDQLFARAGSAHVVGITGVPGSGKSTLVAKLAAAIRRSQRKVAIVAVDPSSPFSGGAILGDRIRMGELAGDAGVYVRSMATRGAMGGLARGTLEAVDVLDAAGYDLVLIETVGVGQDEVDVARAAHTTVVVSAPGLGDDIQAIKAGILEIADILVVNKADLPLADSVYKQLHIFMSLERNAGWQVPILKTVAHKEQGIAELADAIEAHREYLAESGRLEEMRRHRARRQLLAVAQALLLEGVIGAQGDGRVDELVEAIARREIDPRTAAERLISAAKS
jgi:LAO/AO transport system kinase